MTMLMQPFNPMQVDPTQGAGSFPVGKHPVVIESSEIKATKEQNGGYLQFMLRVIDGPLTGTTGPYRLNLYNNSAKAVEIANRDLSAICHVTQTFQLGQNGCDVSVLFNKPFIIEVVPQKGDGGTAGYTEIRKVYDMQGNEAGKQGQGQGGAAQPQQGQQQQAQGGGGWGQQAAQQQAPQGQGGWGQQAQTQQAPQQQPAQGGAQGGWAPQTQQQAPQGNGGGAAWGNGAQQQAPQQQAPQQQPAQGGWQQQAAGGGAPWGARQ